MASRSRSSKAVDGRDVNVVGDLFGAGKHVFAAGGEIRARDEKIGRLAHAVHGGRKGRDGRARAEAVRKAQGKIVLATVKGDVHDIGKNIVGVVLACNNYEVIDLGVMVQCEKILETAKKERADLIGLSGLITPSLDEMTHVAREMERTGCKLPLLIGGATTSKAHTAVKIAQHYSEPVVHVLDASRAVPVTSSLLSKDGKDDFVKKHREEYEKLRASHSGQFGGQTAFAHRRPRQRAQVELRRSAETGIHRRAHTVVRQLRSTVSLEEVVPFIDWTPFFHTWELRGVYPKILQHEKHGEEATKLFAEAQKLLAEIVAKKSLHRASRRLWVVPGQLRGR